MPTCKQSKSVWGGQQLLCGPCPDQGGGDGGAASDGKAAARAYAGDRQLLPGGAGPGCTQAKATWGGRPAAAAAARAEPKHTPRGLAAGLQAQSLPLAEPVHTPRGQGAGTSTWQPVSNPVGAQPPPAEPEHTPRGQGAGTFTWQPERNPAGGQLPDAGIFRMPGASTDRDIWRGWACDKLRFPPHW